MSKHPAHYIGASNEPRAENDFYETPQGVTLALVKEIAHFLKDKEVWEPACGRGAISEAVKPYCNTVWSTDIYDHGYIYTRLRGSTDFFAKNTTQYASRCNTIITNPPYQIKQDNRLIRVEDWIERAFEFPTIDDVFFLLKTTALAGKKRSSTMRKHLHHMYQFEQRVVMLKNGKQPEKGGNMIDFAWFWFKREPSQCGFPTISWIKEIDKI